MAKKAKIIRGWAVVNKGGKLVNEETGSLHPLLVFQHQWRASAAVWLHSEKIVKVEIHIKP